MTKGEITLVALRRAWNAVTKTKDVPTHYWDERGEHKINAKPRPKRILNSTLAL